LKKWINELDLVVELTIALWSPSTIMEMGGIEVNPFEKDVQCKRNDAVDAGVGFIVSFGFFATLFIIATVVKVIGS